MVPVETNPLIRAATKEDALGISHLIIQLSRQFISHEFSPEGEEVLLNSMSTSETRRRIEEGYRYFVAEIDDQLVGVVGVRDNQHLYHLFVAQNHQRRGLASDLWKLAMQECIEHGNPGEFTVNSSLFALEVYKSFGFVAQSEPQDQDGVIYIPMRLKTGNLKSGKLESGHV